MPRRLITFVVGAVVACFLAATALVHWQMRTVDHAASTIASETAPSIEALADARAELRQLHVLLERAAADADAGRPIDGAAIARSQGALRDKIDAYLDLPVMPDELRHWTATADARAKLDAVVDVVVLAGDERDAARLATATRQQVPAVVAELYDALTAGIRTNAEHSRAFAQEIQVFRERTTLLAIVLDVVCTAIAAFGVVLARRLIAKHQALVARHRALLEDRASELDAFAGRVAHDILSPLGTVSLALDLSAKTTDEDKRRDLLARGSAAVVRIKKLVSGLLDFAKAGGRPAPGAHAEVRETIEELVTAMGPAAREARAELTVDSAPRADVACHPGVLTSLLSNLTKNAIKYLGDAPERRVAIRARERGARLRVEVADSGPGIPAGLEEHLFEPYTRGPNASQPGVGLGLATVKRLAEAHGGCVGVESRPGRGSTFWFELPRYDASAASA